MTLLQLRQIKQHLIYRNLLSRSYITYVRSKNTTLPQSGTKRDKYIMCIVTSVYNTLNRRYNK